MLNKPCIPARVLVIAAVVLYGATTGFAQEADLRKHIEGAVDRLEAAMQRGDAAAIAALYTHDAQLLVPNAAPVTGRAAIAALSHPATNIELETLEVEGQSDTAFETGAYTVYGDDQAVLDEGKYVVVWKREDGAWKLHRDIFNSNRSATPSGTEDAATLHRARHGEEVHIAMYWVKPDQQEAFERFVYELLWPATYTVQPEESARVRFWKAAEAHEDGTRFYAFVFDPYMPTGDYEIEHVLAEVHGAEQAAQYMQDFERFVEDYTYTPFIQEK